MRVWSLLSWALCLLAAARASAEPSTPLTGDPTAGSTSAHDHRRFSTREGSSGGLALVDPSSGEVGSVRLQLTLDSLPDDSFLNDGQTVGQARQALSVSLTPLPNLELYAALLGSGTSASQTAAGSAQASQGLALGSLHTQSEVLGAKLFSNALGAFRVGADVRIALRNELGGQLPLLKATSIGLRGASSLDLRKTTAQLPLLARLNVEYLLDNSAVAVEELEDARYAALEVAALARDESRHRINRFERFALSVSRADTLGLGFGMELPLEVATDTLVSPIAEVRLGLPVNRRGYDCPLPPGAAGSPSDVTDGCSNDVGLASWPAQLGLAVRVAPPVRGLSFGLGAELGLSGTSSFVQELAPTAPFTIVVALGYDYDARPAAPRVQATVQAQEPAASAQPAAQPTVAAGAVAPADATPPAAEPSVPSAPADMSASAAAPEPVPALAPSVPVAAPAPETAPALVPATGAAPTPTP